MNKLTVGSLFAGIGGIELGLEWTGGFQTIWQVENDPYAQRVLTKHWPDAGRWDDVRTFPPAPAEDWRCDVICGGFPCQGVSDAGKRAGLSDPRSGLLFEAIRVVRKLRPRYVLLENVAALLHRGMGVVVRELAALGYSVEWSCIPAAAVGAPHIRDRVFILADANGHEQRRRYFARREEEGGVVGRGGEILADTGAAVQSDGGPGQMAGEAATSETNQKERERLRDAARCGGEVISSARRIGRKQGTKVSLGREPVSSMPSGGRRGGSRFFGNQDSQWRSEPNVGRVANGVPARVDRLRCLGNAVVPQVAQWIGQRILEALQAPAAEPGKPQGE